MKITDNGAPTADKQPTTYHSKEGTNGTFLRAHACIQREELLK